MAKRVTSKAGAKKVKKKAAASRTASAARGETAPAKAKPRTDTRASARKSAAAAPKIALPPKVKAVARAATKALAPSKGPRLMMPLAPALTNGNGHPIDSGLNDKDLDFFRLLLLEKRQEIVGNMSGLGSEARNRADAAGELSSMPIHMADVGTDNFEYELTLGLIEGERAIVKEIDEALERINKGTYGLCLATGKPIGKARLKAKPWAKYSYEYALAQEKGQLRRF